jgi:hypothetical protein
LVSRNEHLNSISSFLEPNHKKFKEPLKSNRSLENAHYVKTMGFLLASLSRY